MSSVYFSCLIFTCKLDSVWGFFYQHFYFKSIYQVFVVQQYTPTPEIS